MFSHEEKNWFALTFLPGRIVTEQDLITMMQLPAAAELMNRCRREGRFEVPPPPAAAVSVADSVPSQDAASLLSSLHVPPRRIEKPHPRAPVFPFQGQPFSVAGPPFGPPMYPPFSAPPVAPTYHIYGARGGRGRGGRSLKSGKF